MSFFEFPNTRTYDADLGWIIKHMREMVDQFNALYDGALVKVAEPITWNITTQYEEHTIVIGPDGNTYISKQPVPGGINYTNGDYWEELTALGDIIIEARDAAEAAQAAAEAAEEAARPRVALYIGNSYTEGVGSTDGASGIFARTKGIFADAYMKTTGGASFYAYDEAHEGKTFVDLLNAAIDDSAIPNDDITDVVIVGAIGDTRAAAVLAEGNSNPQQVYVGFENMLTERGNLFRSTAEAAFPKLKSIKYVWCEARSVPVLNSGGITVYPCDSYAVHTAAANALPKAGIEYAGWASWSVFGDSSYLNTDNIHPNDLGYKTISANVIEALTGALSYAPKIAYTRLTASAFIENILFDFAYIQTPEAFRLLSLNAGAGTVPANYTHAANGATVKFDFWPGQITDRILPSFNVRARKINRYGVIFPNVRTLNNPIPFQYDLSVDGTSIALSLTMLVALSGVKADLSPSNTMRTDGFAIDTI